MKTRRSFLQSLALTALSMRIGLQSIQVLEETERPDPEYRCVIEPVGPEQTLYAETVTIVVPGPDETL